MLGSLPYRRFVKRLACMLSRQPSSRRRHLVWLPLSAEVQQLEARLLLSASPFTTLDVPGSFSTLPLSVSGSNVVGFYVGSGGTIHGFLYDGSTFTTLDVPGSTETQATAVSGTKVVGAYKVPKNDPNDPGHPFANYSFLYDASTSTYTTVAVPGSANTSVTGVDGGIIIGTYTGPGGGALHGFLLNGSAYTTFDVPGSSSTLLSDISGSSIIGHYTVTNNFGDDHAFEFNGSTYTTLALPGTLQLSPSSVSGNNVVGTYSLPSKSNPFVVLPGPPHAFLYNGSTYSTIEPPGAVFDDFGPYLASGVYANGISGNNVVGYYQGGTTWHGFLYNGSTYTVLDPPGSTFTKVDAIDGRNVVGSYIDSSGHRHGFLYNIGPDIAPTSLNWSTAQSGVDLAYKINGQVPPGTDVELYWSTSTSFADRINGLAYVTSADSQLGPHQLHVDSTAIASPPPDAKYLLLVTRKDPSQDPTADDVLPLGTPLKLQDFQQTTFNLIADPNPAMPNIKVSAQFVNLGSDPTANTTFHWQAKIQFDASTAVNGPSRTISFVYPVQDVAGSLDYTPDFQDSSGTQEIRGGDLTFVVKADVAGFTFQVTSTKLSVLGQNASEASVRSYIQQQASAQGVGAYAADLMRIARRESGVQQFSGNLPYFSGDGKGGVGLFQITNPAPTDDQVWNWQSNVSKGVAIFALKVTAATRYPARLTGSIGFRNLVNGLNQLRATQHLTPLIVTIPAFTADQLRLDAIRGFNGYAGQDLGLELHEYRLARDAQGHLLVNIIPGTNRATAIWEEVPVSARPTGPTAPGDPNYVNNVLAQAP